MVHIAILGYGVVGSGIAQVLRENRVHIEKKAGQTLAVKRVLDLRDFPGDPIAPLLTHDFADILRDPDIQIVAEVMGGEEPAYSYVKQSLLAGKHVCTSNKELVVKHGAELLAIAREREINFLFEASVGGGIPIVRPMNLALTTDEVVAVAGILNGTTNYILTQMADFGKNFDDALREAQAKGYAEKDPTADVEGYDACRKLAILLSLATGRQVNHEAIQTEGITGLTAEDFTCARHFGYTVKLLVDGRITPDGVEAMVAPMLVHLKHPLATVTDVFNCVSVRAKVTDTVMFYGQGAGKLPTAGAVVSDMVDAAKHLGRHIPHSWSAEPVPVLPVDGYRKRKFIRVGYTDKEAAKNAIVDLYEETIVFAPARWLVCLTPEESETETAEKLARLARSPYVNGARMLRVYQS